MKNMFLEAGRIVNTHGIQGEVKIIPWCDSPEFLLNFNTLYLDEEPVKVLSSRVYKGNLLVTFEGVADVGAAMRLKEGNFSSAVMTLLCRQDGILLPTSSAWKFVTLQTTGCRHPAEVWTPPAQPVYVVKGEREYLIPP